MVQQPLRHRQLPQTMLQKRQKTSKPSATEKAIDDGDNAGNAVNDIVDGVGDGVKDTVDGVEDAVDDVTK